MKDKVIAIDGVSASGKGTLAKMLANHLHWAYLNTGALYRCVALYCIKNNIDYSNPQNVINELKNVSFDDLENEELFIENTGFVASKVSAIQEVRDFLFNFQKQFCENPNGAVLDGRDIGTVICPEAKYKFFVVADAKIRAERRLKDMQKQKINVDFEEILNKIILRDKNDFERKVAPLKKADDAIEIDTGKLTKDEMLQKALSYIEIQK